MKIRINDRNQKVFFVNDLKDAQIKTSILRGNKPAYLFGGSIVMDENDTQIATISYNGKIWDNNGNEIICN